MNPRPIKVECYAGGRAEETPRRIIIDGQVYLVARLLAESIEESLESKERTRRYKLLTDDGLTIEIKQLPDGQWYLISQSTGL